MSETLQTPEMFKKRRKIYFCIIGGVFAAALLLVQLIDEMPVLFPTDAAVSDMERDLKKIEKQAAELEIQVQTSDRVRQAADTVYRGAWNIAAMGDPEVELRAKVQNAAKSMDLKLGNISTVRRTKFNDALSTLELDLTVSCDIDSLVKYFAAVEKIEPKLYWRRFDFRSEGAGSVNFSGSLRCFCDERSAALEIKAKGAEPEKGLDGENLPAAAGEVQ